ncbi:major facilitator superfamily domain-containing protein [Xylaria sp. FL0933]|nr:major facilitator superfamily domain-containing protein [Xylaria sp. FL0933]
MQPHTIEEDEAPFPGVFIHDPADASDDDDDGSTIRNLSRNDHRPQGGEGLAGEPVLNIPQSDGVHDIADVEQGNRRRLNQHECEDELASSFSTRKKWWILLVIFCIQTSINFNATLYSNGIQSRLGSWLFFLTYAVGCELWAPVSEEFGRRVVLQISMTLINLCAIPVGVAPNIAAIVVSRMLGGLSTAGGSVTFGMVADMYDRDSQQYAVAFVIFSSVFGSILGPIIGGFVELLPSSQVWRWCTWIQLIVGGTVQLLHLCTVPETRATVMMNNIAKRRRATLIDPYIYGPGEMLPFCRRLTIHEPGVNIFRGFKMLFTEKIVAVLSLLSGVSDAIVFLQIQSMNLVYHKWHFNSWQTGLAFVPFAIGYLIVWAAMIPTFRSGQRRRDENILNDDYAQFELRLRPLLWAGLCLPVGLFIFAWFSVGPLHYHWIWSMIGTALIGIANYGIYMSTIDYMVCAYGPYSASATAGNGLARDLMAGILTPTAKYFYSSLKENQVAKSYALAIIVLCILSVVLWAAAVWVYCHGAEYRKQSPFAQHLSHRDSQERGVISG